MESLDFNTVLKDFLYKPNFNYYAFEVDGEWRIRIVMYVENSRAPWRRWELKPVPEDEFYFDDLRFRPPVNFIGYSPSREMVEIVGNFPIPPYGPEHDQEFISWMVFQIQHMEEHETYEWLRYKGELINDPHKEVGLDGGA